MAASIGSAGLAIVKGSATEDSEAGQVETRPYDMSVTSYSWLVGNGSPLVPSMTRTRAVTGLLSR